MQSATVPIDETFLVGSPPDAAWRLLTEPAVVVRCMPGAEIIGERDDGTLLGALQVKLGPTVVAFKGEVTPDFNDQAREGSLVAQGADSAGRTRAKATATFAVSPGESFGTSVALTGRIEVSGPLAPFARTGGVHLARRMIADFSANLSAHIEATVLVEGTMRTENTPAQPDVPAVAPVSAIKLLMSVVADLIRRATRRATHRKD